MQNLGDKEITLFKKVAQALFKLGITDTNQLNEALVDSILEILDEKPTRRMILEMFEGYKILQPSYTGDVWVITEHDGEKTIV